MSLTSRLKRLVAEVEVILHVLDVFHSLVHQLDTQTVIKVHFMGLNSLFKIYFLEQSLCFCHLHAASDDPDSVVHVLLPLKGDRALQ